MSIGRFKIFSLVLFLCFTHLLLAQHKVSITIDDVPNTRLYESGNYQSDLLNKIDSLQVPVAIFINEGLIYQTDALAENFGLLNKWLANENTLIGNHTFRHSKYSEVGFEVFSEDVRKGAYMSRELTKKHGKALKYFRFPYNDLGRDSIQHVRMDSFLQALDYISTPFTIESSDWMFNKVYQYYQERHAPEEAAAIGELYVSKTIEYFQFFTALAKEEYGRTVNQIYLCHDNKINADYLMAILSKLEQMGYEFISLEEAMEDSIYAQEEGYYKKWGVSWFYRWMKRHKERIAWMKKEPELNGLEQLYKDIIDQ